ncbi:MAG: YraN family protein [Betaproteobacteria bacterium]|nr:YraN family protein [Betaproteobacteria bacterium]
MGVATTYSAPGGKSCAPAAWAAALSTVVGFTQQKGSEAEDRACRYLQAQGLTLVQRNYRVARGPHRRGGEIDLIMRTPQGTLVFVEVRARAQTRQGGAGASVTPLKQRRLVLAARHYLLRCSQPPPCRFDVVALEGSVLHWWPGAFEATA